MGLMFGFKVNVDSHMCEFNFQCCFNTVAEFMGVKNGHVAGHDKMKINELGLTCLTCAQIMRLNCACTIFGDNGFYGGLICLVLGLIH